MGEAAQVNQGVIGDGGVAQREGAQPRGGLQMLETGTADLRGGQIE